MKRNDRAATDGGDDAEATRRERASTWSKQVERGMKDVRPYHFYYGESFSEVKS